MKAALLVGSAALLSLTMVAESQEKKEPPKKFGDPEALVEFLLKQFDSNQDGKIAKSEARGKIADGFAKLDQNADGHLDRKELRVMAGIAVGQKKGPGPFAARGEDFDALDRDADGRLTREELKNSRLLARFAEIDTNSDGRIERREFEAHQRKTADKK
jgi:Ca2+-binding EF-hand superfamily protein